MSQALLLEIQLDRQAAEDDAWLRARAKARYLGVERDERGEWWATVHRMVTSPWDPPRLCCTWFPGATPAEATAKARRWVEERLGEIRGRP